MTTNEIEQIFDTINPLPYDARRFAFREGLRILCDLHEDSEDWSCELDQFWYGSITDVADKITPEQCIRLRQLGWFVEDDAFSIYC